MNYLNIIKSTILMGLLFAAPVGEAANPAEAKHPPHLRGR